jgi:hypothetical protein
MRAQGANGSRPRLIRTVMSGGLKMTSRGWRNPVRPRELVADSECRLM